MFDCLHYENYETIFDLGIFCLPAAMSAIQKKDRPDYFHQRIRRISNENMQEFTIFLKHSSLNYDF